MKATTVFLTAGIAAALSSFCSGSADPTGAPELVANVSLLLADHHGVDCVQIFRPRDLSPKTVEFVRRTWKSLAAVESKRSAGVYTYERYARRKRTEPRKVSCYRALKILHDDEESRRGYANLTQEFAIKDSVWLLFLNRSSLSFFRYANVMFDDVIVLAFVESSDLVLFYEIYRVNPDFPMRNSSLGRWTKQEGLLLTGKSFFERRSNLEGASLRAGLLENWPATYWKNGKWHGFLVKLWKEIQERINCTSIDIRSTDNLIGMKTENGSWDGLVGKALKNEIDIIVSEIVIDKRRSHVLKFLHPIMKSRFQIYTKHLDYEWQWTSVLKPFRAGVWFATLAWIVAAASFLTFAHDACLSRGLEPAAAAEKPFAPFESLLFVMQASCQQGYHAVPESHTCRILFFVCYAASAVLVPSYSASLVSSLAQKTRYRSFDSLREMVEDGTYNLIVRDDSLEHGFFAHAKDDFFRKAYSKLALRVPAERRKMDVSDSLDLLCHLPKHAVFGMEETVNVRMRRRGKPECTVVPLGIPVTEIHVTMATSRRNPFWGLINHHLQILINNGIVSRLKRSEFPSVEPENAPEEKGVGLGQLISAFAFVAFFALVSVVVLLLEIRRHRSRTVREKIFNRKKRLRRRQRRAETLKLPMDAFPPTEF